MMAVRWGIVSAGRISHDFVTCLNSLPRDEHQIIAVAARSLDSAQKFATEHNISKAYGNYEELGKNKDIEIVYVANLNPDHFKVCKMLFEYGKHILCEKPMCMNLKETEQLIEIAKKHGLFFMEAVWSRCFPIYQRLREELAKASIGTPNMVQVMFAFNGDDRGLDRVQKRNLGGSVVLDIGVYAIQFASLVYGGEKPEKIVASGFLNEEGVDTMVLIALHYSNQRVANLSLSIKTSGCNEAAVAGAKGFIKLKHLFYCATEMETPTQTYKEELPKVKGHVNFPNSQGLTYEAQHVRECLRKGLLESPLMSLNESKVLSYIMTEVRKQLGAVDA